MTAPSLVDCLACGEHHRVRHLPDGPFTGLLWLLERGLLRECTAALKMQAEVGLA